VGHTPFGHAGEAAMAELTGHFAHNEQSLRVVEFLEKGGKGLNLTREVKDGIVNHTGKHLPKTLEGRIVRTADRIAYLAHDYDDSLRAGLLKPGDLPQVVYERLGTDTSHMITSMVADMITASAGKDDILQGAACKEAMDVFRSFMFERIYRSDVLAHERRQATFVLRELYGYFLSHFDALPQEFAAREACWGRQQTVTGLCGRAHGQLRGAALQRDLHAAGRAHGALSAAERSRDAVADRGTPSRGQRGAAFTSGKRRAAAWLCGICRRAGKISWESKNYFCQEKKEISILW
jgi:dGTP triphosphohydrolase